MKNDICDTIQTKMWLVNQTRVILKFISHSKRNKTNLMAYLIDFQWFTYVIILKRIYFLKKFTIEVHKIQQEDPLFSETICFSHI